MEKKYFTQNRTLNYIILATSLCVVLFNLTACNDSTSSGDKAVQLYISTLSNSPGYEWFPLAYNNYIPDTTITNKIKAAYDSTHYQFLTLVNPSCSCEGTQALFPKFMKILTASGIPESHIIIYSVNNINTPNPWSSKIDSLNILPALYAVKDSMLVYSIRDTLSNHYKDSISPEILILESIQ